MHVDWKTASLYLKVYIEGFKLFCSRLYTVMKSVRDFTFYSPYVDESGQVFWVVTLSSRVTDYRRFERTWYLVTQWSRTTMAEVDEQRVCIKFCVRLGKTGSETFEMLKQAFGDSCMSRSRTFEWFGRCNKLTRKTLTSSLFVLKNTGISLNFRVK